MEARSLPTAIAQPRAVSRAAAVPLSIAAILFAATSIVVGVIWDISWHMTIGRDTFWTPAHLAIYLGGLVGGLGSGLVVLRTTFRGTPDEHARSVGFWGFRGPLGAWAAILGAGAMLTSAPFDDWWHNAYGLDVRIISPPHMVLAVGIYGIVMGALLITLAAQNRAAEAAAGARAAGDPGLAGTLSRLYAYASGLLIAIVAIMVTEHSYRTEMHSSVFYRWTGAVFPFFLCMLARGSRLRWPATAAALGYTGVMLAMQWILPLFPATPKLGPIYQVITHMVPMSFPLLLVAPALAMDAIGHAAERRGWNDWVVAALAGLAFVAVLLAVQWPFATFLLSPAARNWVFAGDNFTYSTPPTAFGVRGIFYLSDRTRLDFWQGMGLAVAYAVVSARLGLWRGNALRRVRR
jgi:hypothetical protein